MIQVFSFLNDSQSATVAKSWPTTSARNLLAALKCRGAELRDLGAASGNASHFGAWIAVDGARLNYSAHSAFDDVEDCQRILDNLAFWTSEEALGPKELS